MAVLVLAVVAGIATSAVAERSKQLGKTRQKAQPACKPRTDAGCQITGQVTGFQRSVDGKANLFKAQSSGRIVAWSVSLGKPSKDAREAFGEAGGTNEFGPNPTAGISILRKKSNGEFRLMRASPILKVQSYYGEKPLFTLRDPLRIKKGNIVALTTATWLPAFSVKGQTRDDVWVGSRTKKNCDITDRGLDYFFAHTKPHRKAGTDRKYKCAYTRARILYWAYLAPNR